MTDEAYRDLARLQKAIALADGLDVVHPDRPVTEFIAWPEHLRRSLALLVDVKPPSKETWATTCALMAERRRRRNRLLAAVALVQSKESSPNH